MTHYNGSGKDIGRKTGIDNNRLQNHLEEYGLSFLDIILHDGFEPILRAFVCKVSDTFVKAIKTSTFGLPEAETWEEIVIDEPEHNYKEFS